MHNLKEIRKNFDDFKVSLKDRFLKIDFNQLKDLDIKNRNFIQKKELLENEKKKFQSLKMKNYLKNQKKFQMKLTKYQNNKK